MDTIFWDVDTQVDFISPQGKLYVPGAEQIVPTLALLKQFAKDNGVLVIASACAHHEGDEEFQQFPAHCIVGTPGQKKIPETTLEMQLVIPNRRTEIGNFSTYQQVVIEKDHFDVFSNPNTEAVVANIRKGTQIFLYGVVTEICVACAARGLLERGHKVTVLRNAVHHLDAEKAQALFDELQRRGGRVADNFAAAQSR